MFLRKLLLIIFYCQFFIFFNSHDGLAVGKSKPKSSTRIRSDIIDIKRKTQVVTFINNVVVEKDDSSLLAHKMILLYEEKQEKEKDQKSKPSKEVEVDIIEKKPKTENANEETSIKRIDAFGDVKIFSDDFVGSGDTGYYEPKENIFVLEKNVIVNNGSSLATGEKFVYNIVTKKGNFVGKKEETSIKDRVNNQRVMIILGGENKD